MSFEFKLGCSNKSVTCFVSKLTICTIPLGVVLPNNNEPPEIVAPSINCNEIKLLEIPDSVFKVSLGGKSPKNKFAGGSTLTPDSKTKVLLNMSITF